MQKELDKMLNTFQRYEIQLADADRRLRKICDFNARLSFCAGDGHLVLNEDTAVVAKLDCLAGKSMRNKVTIKDHEFWSL